MKNIVTFGHIAFLVGMILAILAAFINISNIATYLLILGIIIGFLNVSEKESTHFLVAIIALLMASTAVLQVETADHQASEQMLFNLIAFMSPAAFVVALKQIFVTARSPE